MGPSRRGAKLSSFPNIEKDTQFPIHFCDVWFEGMAAAVLHEVGLGAGSLSIKDRQPYNNHRVVFLPLGWGI